MFGEVKIMKGLAGFELMTDRFLVSAKTHCDTLLGNNTQTCYLKLYLILMFISMGSTSKYHMKWKLVCVCKCGSRIFFFQGTIVIPGGSSPFFRYIYYVNLVLNFPGARGSGPLGIFKLFIRSAHGIYLFVCTFM